MPPTGAPGESDGIGSLSAKSRKLLADNMQKGETVEFCLVGFGDQVLVALNERLLIIKSGLLAGALFGQRVTSFHYRDITSVEVSTDPLQAGIIQICTPSYQVMSQLEIALQNVKPNSIRIFNAKLKAAQPLLDKLRAKINAAKCPVPPAANPGSSNLAAELEKLATLHSSGALTDDEFRSAKNRLLGQ